MVHVNVAFEANSPIRSSTFLSLLSLLWRDSIRCFCVVLSLCIDAAYTVFESRWHCCYLYAGFKRSSYKVLLCFISNRQYVRVWKLLLRYLLFVWGFQENVLCQNGRNRKLSFLSLYIICINMWMIIQTTNTLTQI